MSGCERRRIRIFGSSPTSCLVAADGRSPEHDTSEPYGGRYFSQYGTVVEAEVRMDHVTGPRQRSFLARRRKCEAW